MRNWFSHLIFDEEGATMVEYALMVALVGASLVGVVTTLSGSIGTKLSSVSTMISP